jgi:CheY-like chemotaxis protein
MSAGILIADDEPDVVELFRQRFRHEIKAGAYRLHFASSGEGALAALVDGLAPDLVMVLSDINMPGMNGFDLLRRVKQIWPDMPVLMISAYADEENRQRASQYGAESFIAKPVDFAALKSLIRDLSLRPGAPA